MATIVHFEIPANDVNRAKKFYQDLFGWSIEKFQSESGAASDEYWMITTTNEKGERVVCGGLMKRQHPQQAITNYIDVPSVDEYSAKIQKQGGKILVPKTAVPKYGYFVICQDPENNVFGIWQCDEAAK